jgi:DNA repair protein RecN (Recombination protein N)
MLAELIVENYAVIERLHVRFCPGLNLLTGETGSGKSIVVGALGLLMGGRASTEMIRSGADRARVSGIIEIPPHARLSRVLEAAGMEMEEGELLIEREILAGGKSRAFLQSRPVAVSVLKDLAPCWGDIHGQNDQQELFSSGAQREMLDAFAGSRELLEKTAAAYRKCRECRAELETLEHNEQEKIRLLDLWAFQKKEIEAASPNVGEDIALEAEKRRLQNYARLQETATAAYQALYDAPDSALARLRAARKRLDELARIEPMLVTTRETLQPAEYAVEEVSYVLRDYLSKLEAKPARLEEIEDRLALLDKLKRKYGPTLEQVLAYLDDVRTQITALEHNEERREVLLQQLAFLEHDYEEVAAALSDLRKQAAQDLERRVEAELAQLAMERTVFRIRLSSCAWSETGFDEVTFLVSPNVGEEPKPLEKIASGGEISRIALALKSCLAAKGPEMPSQKGAGRTLVFDEVDAGIGGRAAEMVGRRLKQLAEADQVLCVTHLPQIAGFADHHYYVEKRQVNGRTVAQVTKLTADGRTREIARMLSGQKLTPEALKHAEKLIQTGSAARRGRSQL